MVVKTVGWWWGSTSHLKHGQKKKTSDMVSGEEQAKWKSKIEVKKIEGKPALMCLSYTSVYQLKY